MAKKGGGKKGGKGGKKGGKAAAEPTNVQKFEPPPPPRPVTPPPKIMVLPLNVKKAAEEGDELTVRRWLDEENGHPDATFRASERLHGRTLLMTASAHGKENVVLAVLDRGASMDLQDSRGDTALMLAGRARQNGYGTHDKHDRIVLYLLKEGARTDLMNLSGQTAQTHINPTFAPGAPGGTVDATNALRPKSAPHRLRLVSVAPGGAFNPPGATPQLSLWNTPASPWKANF